MTTDELSKLSAEQKRIAIATICGWHLMSELDGEKVFSHPNGGVALHPDKEDYCKLPNYCGSLDAMHEAEKVLKDGLDDRYWVKELPAIVGANTGWLHKDIPLIASATASQRADAFLMTIEGAPRA